MIARLKSASLALALAAGLALGAPVLAQTAAPAAFEASALELAGADGRAIPVSVWRAQDERGVIVFSHGHGGRPAAYHRLLSRWVDEGFTVVAPLHVDSMAHPDRESFDGPGGFGARLEDLAVVRDHVRDVHSGQIQIAAGHSYGSLMSVIAGGATTIVGPQGDPDVRAVVALSSAGDLDGLVTPTTYDTLAVPTLMVTGDADIVPGFVDDWTGHRGPFDRSPAGDKMLVVFAGGDHSLPGNAEPAQLDFIVEATVAFMAAHALGDAEARARLDALSAPDGVTIERR